LRIEGRDLATTVSTLQKQIEAWTTPSSIKTDLHLVFDGPNARAIGQNNIWRWFTLYHRVDQVDKDTAQITKSIINWEVFLVFDRPIALTQILIPGAAALPANEIKDATNRSAILVFHGDLSNKTIEIKVVL
jgi:hypothetical protein